MTDIVLHVGAHKTGSSSIQATLNAARYDLLNEGIGLYEGVNHTDFYRGFTDCHESYHQYYRGWRRKIRKDETRNKIKQFYSRRQNKLEIVSSEDISLLSIEALSDLKRFLFKECGFSKVTVICYLRAPLDYLNSSIQQFIKPGLTSLNDILNDRFDNYRLQGCPSFMGGAQNILQQLYFPIPEKLVQVFGRESVKFIKLEDAASKGVTAELFRQIGDGYELSWLEEIRKNESMSHEACLLISEFNDRNPLLQVNYKLNKQRNREKCYVPFVRNIDGRKANLLNYSVLDLALLNSSIKSVNQAVDKELFECISFPEMAAPDSGFFHFSEKAMSIIAEYLGGTAVESMFSGGVNSIEQLRAINREIEKKRKRDCSWAANLLNKIYR